MQEEELEEYFDIDMETPEEEVTQSAPALAPALQRERPGGCVGAFATSYTTHAAQNCIVLGYAGACFVPYYAHLGGDDFDDEYVHTHPQNLFTYMC